MLFVPVAILAPLLVLKLLDGKNKMTSLKKTKDLWKVAFLASIVVTGVFSAFLTFEYQILLTEKNMITTEELGLLETLQGADPYSSLLVVTERTRSVAEAGMFGQVLDANRLALWDWSTPEMPLNAISSLNGPIIFFLTDRDKNIISREYSDGYLGSHLEKIASYLSNENEDPVTYLPKLSPPVSQSSTVLVLPEEQNHIYHVYDFLSIGNYNYTTALLHDMETIRHANVLIVPNEKIGIQLMEVRHEYGLKFDKMVVFNLDGAQFPSRLTINQDIIAENFTVLANYEHGVPLVLQKKFKDFNFYHVNVEPILQEFEEGRGNSKDFKVLYSSVLEIVDEDLPRHVPTERYKFRFQPDGYFTFNNLHATGDLTFSSPSIISKIDSQIRVNTDGEDYNYENISLIFPVSVDKSTIKAKEALQEDGTGFYSRIIMNSSNIVFQGNPAIISLVSKDGDIKKIEGQHIQIDLFESINLIRQPSIQVEGMMEFEEIVAHGALEKKLRTAGGKHNRLLDTWSQDLIVEGFGNFTIKFSDDYSFANKVTLKGKKEYSDPIYAYNELKNLLNFFTFSNKLL